MTTTEAVMAELKSITRENAPSWGLMFALGALMVVLGILALGAPIVLGIASVFFFGAFLAAAGIIEGIQAIRGRKVTAHWVVYLLSGILAVVAGVLMFARPAVALSAITLMLAAYFFANGLFRVISSLMLRYRAWGADLLVGLLSVALGAIIIVTWPESSLFLVGTLIGVEIIFRGVSQMAVSLAVRRTVRHAPAY